MEAGDDETERGQAPACSLPTRPRAHLGRDAGTKAADPRQPAPVTAAAAAPAA